VVDSVGRRALLARTDFRSRYRIKRYGIDVAGLESFIAHLGSYEPRHLLYLDEIGPMQLLAKSFRLLVWELLEAENAFLGTVTAAREDPLIQTAVSRNDVTIYEVTAANRDSLTEELAGRVRHSFAGQVGDQVD
jgi:nucleoside-triphosphatase